MAHTTIYVLVGTDTLVTKSGIARRKNTPSIAGPPFITGRSFQRSSKPIFHSWLGEEQVDVV